MSDPRLEHQNVKIRQLIDDYRSGRIVIPEFQREYVWKKSRAPLLVDSLYRGFPISSLLLWQSDEETRARRRDPRPTRVSLMSWLIDGQQRVITLARTLSGDEGIDVVFNPKEDMFRLANAATQKDSNWVRVSVLWDDELYRQLRRNLDGGSVAERREARFEKVRGILDYEVPLVRMVDHSFRDAVDAFRRINTLGVRLKKEDIESAQAASRHTGFIADLKACREDDPIGSLLKNLRQEVRSSLVADPSDFSGALADRSGLLALYIACMNRGILDFYTGSKVLLQNNIDRHHILPRAQFPDSRRAKADNVANIAFIVGDVNKSIGQTGPEIYLPSIAAKVLESQCIPSDASLWAVNRASEFWAARRDLLASSFNDFLRESLPQRRLGMG